MKKILILTALASAVGIYAQTGSISGRVLDELGLLSIQGVKVHAVYDSAGITVDQGEDITDNAGYYQITGLTPGYYALDVEMTGYYPVEYPELVALEANENLSSVAFYMIAVYDSFDISGSVRLIDFYGGNWTGNTWAVSKRGYVLKTSQLTPKDSLGTPTGLAEYSISDLLYTQCYFLSTVPGYVPQYYNHVYASEEAFCIYPPQNNINFDLERAADSTLNGGVSGIIRGMFGPLPYSFVYARKDGLLVSGCINNENGRYWLPLAPGVYSIYATRPGYKRGNYSNDVTVADQNVQNIDIQLDISGQTAIQEKPDEKEVISLVLDRNPGSSSSIIVYNLRQPGRVEIKMYDVTGALIRTLVNDYQSAGEYKLQWDGKDEHSQLLASGIYFCRLRQNNISVSKALRIIR